MPASLVRVKSVAKLGLIKIFKFINDMFFGFFIPLLWKGQWSPVEVSDKPTLAFFGLGLGPQMGWLYPSYSVNQVPMKSAYGFVQSAKES